MTKINMNWREGLAPAAKQVIYVDVDDEITGIVDKVNSANARVIALVLPKRAAVFQSIVNMKLLKRQTEQSGKHLVLITSEAGLMPLAGLAGVYVAPTLQSKPSIPAAPADSDLPDDADEEPVDLGDFNARNAATAVGTLAADQPETADLPDDVVELDSAAPVKGGKASPQMAAAAASVGQNSAQKSKTSKDKKLQVPNFFKFRNRIILLVVGLLVLAGLWYVGWFVLPKATVTVRTNTSDIDTSLALTLDIKADQVDLKDSIVPAKLQQQQKNNTQQVPATGQENKGDKATGKVTLSLTGCGDNTITVPAGTGLSSGGMTFITQNGATLQSVQIGGKCQNDKFADLSTATVDVVAQKAGAGYNIAAATFSGAPSGVSAKSSDPMAGGTDNIVKIVQQADIDSAKTKLASGSDKDEMKKELQKSLEDASLFALPATFNAAGGDLTTSVKVGDEAEAITASETVTYTMYGVKKADLRKLVEASAEGKIDRSKQSITDDGLSGARVSVETPGAGEQQRVDMRATVVAGPQLDAEKLKQEATGKKSGEVRDAIKSNPGVEAVDVKYSPFWVTKAPKPAKITIVFEKSGKVQQSSGQSPSDDKDKTTESGGND